LACGHLRVTCTLNNLIIAAVRSYAGLSQSQPLKSFPLEQNFQKSRQITLEMNNLKKEGLVEPKIRPLSPADEVPHAEWPPQPAPLKTPGYIFYLRIITDAACIFTVIPFLDLAGVAARRNDRDALSNERVTVHLVI